MPQEPNSTPEVCQIVGVFEVVCQRCHKQRRLPVDSKLCAAFHYTCKDCCEELSVADMASAEIEKQQKGKEASRRWRANHKAEAAEYKRRQRAAGSYDERRKDLESDVAWAAKLKEFGYACSTPGCGRSLTLQTAIRSADGPTYVPICRHCLCSKAAKEKAAAARRTKEEA